MTELFIDGISVVLPKDFSTTVKTENPFFTKNGEYTYDITLSLTNPVNAQLYGHLNRLNSISGITEKRRAVLIADNRVYCNGTEIVTGWTEETVSIQVASGNSELNFFIGEDLPISFLDMGEDVIPTMTNQAKIAGYLDRIYPEVDYCMAPVMTDEGSINGWRVNFGYQMDNWRWTPQINTYYFSSVRVNIYLQPYLCAYIKRMMKAIGYKILINQLEDSEWKLLYLPQNGHPTKYAQMFPGWRVNEFIKELENLFNLCFLVNNKSREVSIIFNSEYYKNAQTFHVGKVTDVYETEDAKEDSDLSHSNILLEPADSGYYKLQHIDRNILSSVTRKSLGTYADIVSFLGTIGNKYQDAKNYLFFVEDSCRYYAVAPGETNENWRLEEVNMFGDVLREDTETDITLNMIPADMVDYGIEPVSYAPQNPPVFITDSERSRTMIPKIYGNQVNVSNEGSGLYEKIQSGSSVGGQEGKNGSKLYVCFYKGMTDLTVYPKSGGAAGDIVPGPYEGFIIKFPHSFNCEDAPFSGNLRLAYLNKMLYSNMYDIDVDRKIKFTCHDANVYDVRNIFEIRNKRYVCRDIEYSINATGRNGAWIGAFYPIRINDIEADKRWILTDGRWRDGGVWMDNGRWMDE